MNTIPFPYKAAIAHAGIGFPVLVVAVAALVWLAGANPVHALSAFIHGAFGSRYLFAETVVTAIPLALVALGVMPALKAGIFTIGSQGQLVAGAALATAFIQATEPGNGLILLTAGLVGGLLGGMMYALIPGLLRAFFSVNEILSTLLLNYIAGFGLVWLLKGSLATSAQTATPRSDPLPAEAIIPAMIEGTRLHWGLIFVVLFALGLWIWTKTRSGLVYSIFSSHPGLAARLGLSAPKAIITSFLLAGGAAGLAGWIQVAGVTHTLYASVDGGLGFAGILVAILGGLHPLGILGAALLFAALSTGAQGMQMGTSVPAAIAVVMQGIVLLIVAIGFQSRKRKA